MFKHRPAIVDISSLEKIGLNCLMREEKLMASVGGRRLYPRIIEHHYEFFCEIIVVLLAKQQ